MGCFKLEAPRLLGCGGAKRASGRDAVKVGGKDIDGGDWDRV